MVGYPAGNASAYFLNRLTPPSYPATLRSILIYFGNQENGLTVQQSIHVLAGSNPSGNSNLDGIFLNHLSI
jgi:hypothetical protein